MNSIHRVLRPLRGANLEVFKFGMYLMFPIGWMYYFGTNLENRFSVNDFWPTQEQSHKIPFEKEEIKAEVERIQRELRRKQQAGKLQEARAAFATSSSPGASAIGLQDSPKVTIDVRS